jgi:hydrogenase maturation protein HypF
LAGIILDGTGLGTDGTVWGGEVLLGDYHGFERRAWLKPAPMIGGDMAAREPWRNALARLDQAGLSDWADELFADKPLAMARMAAAKGVNAPMSSSAGRLFDAVAACLGVCADRQSYEGEAAMRLEALADSYLRTHSPAHGFGFDDVEEEIDPARMFKQIRRSLIAGESPAHCAALFHIGLARAFAQRIHGLYENLEAEAVVLSGGCFQNALLLRLVSEQINTGQFPVLTHRTTLAGDGGLALGQAVIAAARHLKR